MWKPVADHPNLGPVGFELAELPDQMFVLFFPECLMAADLWMPWVTPDWQFEPEKARARIETDVYVFSAELCYTATSAGPAIRWRYEIENRSDSTLRDVSAFNCVYLAHAPGFLDVPMERTYARDAAGEVVCVRDIPKTVGFRTLQFYRAAGGPDAGRSPFVACLEALCRQELSGDRMWVVSADGEWKVETVVEGPVAYFFNNWESDHGCIHAAPLFGDLAPGRSATAQGGVHFTRMV